MKVSILLITYNHNQHIRQAIESILMQKECPEFEIILADDGSSDDTFTIAKKALDGVSNVSFYSNEKNLGITRNYQKGFALCKGEYVFVLEGDDYWIDPHKIKKQVAFLDSHPACSMCFHPYLEQRGNTAIFNDPFYHTDFFRSELFALNDLIMTEGLIGNFSVCCYRNKYLQQLPQAIFDVVSYDWIVNICMGEFGFLGRVNEQMSVYRLSEKGVWSSKTLKEKLEGTISQIKTYDPILQFRYTEVFTKKIDLLQKHIDSLSRPKQKASMMPPVIKTLARNIIPPYLWEKMHRKIR